MNILKALRWELRRRESQANQLNDQVKQLRSALGALASGRNSAGAGRAPKKRRMSAAGRRAIAAAARRRWAAWRAAQKS
jgi:X-X-X-Leu-X-X-Gly heptad repeat protein